MLLGEILHQGVVKTSLESTEKYAAIAELVDLLVEAGDLDASLRDHIRESVEARERSMGTGMEMGVALPHGSSDRLHTMIGALGIARGGIDFNCLDGLPARFILLLVLPRDEFQIHVRTLAGISHLLNETSFRDALINAKDVDEILDRIQKEEKGSIFDRLRKRL